MEAQAIVAEILARFAADPEDTPSIGVITFNVQQRALIEGSLRDSGDHRIVRVTALDVPVRSVERHIAISRYGRRASISWPT